MNSNMADFLQYLPMNQWHKLKGVFRRNWPHLMAGYTMLNTIETIIKRGWDYNIKVYCPFGDVENGMVAIDDKGALVNYVMHCPKTRINEFEKALRSTQILNHPKFYVPCASKHVMDIVHRVSKEVWNAKVESITTSEFFVLNRTSPFDVQLPPDYTFKLMTPEYVELVNSSCSLKHATSEYYYKMITKVKLGYGLFHKDELLAWVYTKESGAIGHLYTLEKHRRKRYGDMVMKLIANKLLEQGKPIFGYCVVGNTGAREMYVKIGSESIELVTRTGFISENNKMSKI